MSDVRCSDERSGEGSNRQQSDNETFSYDGEVATCYNAWGFAGGEPKLEVFHEQDVGNLPCVVLHCPSCKLAFPLDELDKLGKSVHRI